MNILQHALAFVSCHPPRLLECRRCRQQCVSHIALCGASDGCDNLSIVGRVNGHGVSVVEPLAGTETGTSEHCIRCNRHAEYGTTSFEFPVSSFKNRENAKRIPEVSISGINLITIQRISLET
jgi:hypothetical protein